MGTAPTERCNFQCKLPPVLILMCERHLDPWEGNFGPSVVHFTINNKYLVMQTKIMQKNCV